MTKSYGLHSRRSHRICDVIQFRTSARNLDGRAKRCRRMWARRRRARPIQYTTGTPVGPLLRGLHAGHIYHGLGRKNCVNRDGIPIPSMRTKKKKKRKSNTKKNERTSRHPDHTNFLSRLYCLTHPHFFYTQTSWLSFEKKTVVRREFLCVFSITRSSTEGPSMVLVRSSPSEVQSDRISKGAWRAPGRPLCDSSQLCCLPAQIPVMLPHPCGSQIRN